jgi:MoxR-like ATPase
MADNPFVVDNYSNEDVLLMAAAAVQAPGVEDTVLGLPVLLWGAPGVGKTSRLGKLAKGLGYKYMNKSGQIVPGAITVLASIRAAADFLGIPIPGATLEVNGQEIKVLSFAPPDWAISASVAARGGRPGAQGSPRALVFFDEFTTAPPDVQASMLRVIHERIVGDFPLPPNVAVLAAANPPAMSPGGTNLSSPVANRFIHLYWTPPSPEQWAAWVSGAEPTATQAINATGYPTVNIEQFNSYLTQFRQAVANWIVTDAGRAFLFRMPGQGADKDATDEIEAITNYFADNPEKGSGQIRDLNRVALFTDQWAWPSPRSLEIAIRARAACMALDGVDQYKRQQLAEAITCGTIGTTACGSLNSFFGNTVVNNVTVEEFIAAPGVRRAYFNRTKSQEDLREQLAAIVFYFRGLSLKEKAAKLDAVLAAIDSFRSSAIMPTEAAAVGAELRAWLKSPESARGGPGDIELVIAAGKAIMALVSARMAKGA